MADHNRDILTFRTESSENDGMISASASQNTYLIGSLHCPPPFALSNAMKNGQASAAPRPKQHRLALADGNDPPVAATTVGNATLAQVIGAVDDPRVPMENSQLLLQVERSPRARIPLIGKTPPNIIGVKRARTDPFRVAEVQSPVCPVRKLSCWPL